MLDGPEVKVIYTKRYLPDERDENTVEQASGAVDASIPAMPEETQRWDGFVAKWNHMIENSVYIPLRRKIKNLRGYINLAIRFSSEYEIGIDIKDHFYYTSVTLYYFCGVYDGAFMTMLAALIDMSDKFTSLIPADKSCDFIISLDYFTHDHYAEGKKLNF